MGLASAAAGQQRAHLAWDARAPDGSPLQVGLFQSTSRSTLFQGQPIHTASGAGTRLVTGLTDDLTVYFGLALSQGGGQYSPAGAVMSVMPGAEYHVPSVQYPDLITAVLVAASFSNGGQQAANVWVAEGTYTDVSVPLHAGVHVYGGFDASFDLATRDPAAHPTVLRAQTGAAKAVVTIQDGKPGAVLDGIEIDGLSTASAGVDVVQSPARLSSLLVRDCAGRGIRLRSLASNVVYDVTLARCSVRSCGGEGLQLQGPFELSVEGSLFSVNSLEGFDCDDLVAPSGFQASLSVRDSVFFGNGGEGLDCDLGVPPAPGSGGAYEVTVQGSLFEQNGWGTSAASAGLNIDIDYEAFPAWRSEIVVRGSTARANRGHGARLDLDSTSTTFVHRLLATANSADGLAVSSESKPGLALVSASVLSGNRGAGVRASGGATGGNVPVALSHCILAGNRKGGLISEQVESIAVSSAAWLQSSPWAGAGGVRAHFVAQGNDPLAALFAVAPMAYRGVLKKSGSVLTLDDASDFAPGDPLELADDGVLRSVIGLSGPDGLEIAPAAGSLLLPALIARFAPLVGVGEDYTLAALSAALGAGMPAPVGPAPDAGVFGAPLGGSPGNEGPLPQALFRASATSPPTTTPLDQGDQMRMAFLGGVLDSTTIPGNVRVRNGSNVLVALSPAPFLDVGTGELVIPAPSLGGWPTGKLTLELHAGLSATDGTPIATTLALPFQVQ